MKHDMHRRNINTNTQSQCSPFAIFTPSPCLSNCNDVTPSIRFASMKIYVQNNLNQLYREPLSTPPVAAPNISRVFVQEVSVRSSLLNILTESVERYTPGVKSFHNLGKLWYGSNDEYFVLVRF